MKPSPHVIMISAYGNGENYSHAIKYEANGFLAKPVDFTSLKEKLKMLTT